MSRRIADGPGRRPTPSDRHRQPRRPRLRPAAPPAEDSYTTLMKLKELLDVGALTQAEFDTEKQKVLGA